MTRRYMAVVFITVFILGLSFALAQEQRKVPAYAPADSGQQMYVAYCASCHGKDAKGNGPAAGTLKVAPPDLTRLSASHQGKFPEAHVYTEIRCSRHMPGWGTIFSSLDRQDQALVKLRLRNLTKYIESLQQGSGS
ncbi:MAG: cytochrome c [Terriglobales bacterium]